MFSFSFSTAEQAQVEAKKEHEGAVQLLEVSTGGWVRLGGLDGCLKINGTCCVSGTQCGHSTPLLTFSSEAHFLIDTIVISILTSKQTAQRSESTFPQPHSLGQSCFHWDRRRGFFENQYWVVPGSSILQVMA